MQNTVVLFYCLSLIYLLIGYSSHFGDLHVLHRSLPFIKKIHDPWLKDLGPRVRSTWDNSENLRILKKSPSLLSHMFGINQMQKICVN